MNPVAIAAIAGGVLLVYHETKKNDAPVAQTMGAADLDVTDPILQKATLAVIQKETDPAAKQAFAQALLQAGYPKSAAALGAASKGT